MYSVWPPKFVTLPDHGLCCHQIGQNLWWKFEVPADFDRLLQETAKRRVLRFRRFRHVMSKKAHETQRMQLKASILIVCHWLIVELVPFLTCFIYIWLLRSTDSCDLSGPTQSRLFCVGFSSWGAFAVRGTWPWLWNSQRCACAALILTSKLDTEWCRYGEPLNHGDVICNEIGMTYKCSLVQLERRWICHQIYSATEVSCHTKLETIYIKSMALSKDGIVNKKIIQ